MKEQIKKINQLDDEIRSFIKKSRKEMDSIRETINRRKRIKQRIERIEEKMKDMYKDVVHD